MLYVKELYKSYETGKNKYEVLKGIDFHVPQGEFVAVMGPSGSGKTTLLNCISCYIPFDKGNIRLGGMELAGMNEEELARVRNTKIGFVFQDFMLLDGLTIRENILVPRIVQEEVGQEAEKLADQLAAMFGIVHILNKYPAEISGGEKQRAAVARSLINNPLIILADEPTGSVILVQHYPKVIPVIFPSLSIFISSMTDRQRVRFSSRVKVLYIDLKSAAKMLFKVVKSGGVSCAASGSFSSAVVYIS